jgi:arylsulfatase A-like enzyme
MRIIIALLSLLLSARAQAAVGGRPNIVLIYTDDQPHSMMGAMGNVAISTPNLDRLAADGVLFENMFVTTAICMVSRASLLTGQHMIRHGVGVGFGGLDKPLTAEQWRQTFPALLRSSGYRTAFLGKFAVGKPRTFDEKLCLPAHEFDLWYGFPQQISFRQNSDGQERYLTTVMEEKATRFLREQPRDRPFLLMLALKEPHGPLDLEDPDLPGELVRGPIVRPKTLSVEAFERLPAAVRQGLNSHEPRQEFFTDDRAYQKHMAQIYRYVSRADMAVGRVMAALRELGFDRNTVVIFTSDNGSMEGAHRLVGKWNMYEESIRVPLIIRDPRLPAATRGRRTQTALNIDLAPTILSLAGVPVPAAMQGADLRPILRDGMAKGRDDWFYQFDVVGPSPRRDQPLPRCEGVHAGRWKYIRYLGTEPLQEELFDLGVDRHEEHNLVGRPEQARILADLRARCDEFRRQLR